MEYILPNSESNDLLERVDILNERIQYLRTEVRKYKYDFLTGLKLRMDFDGYLKSLFEMFEFEDRLFTLVLIDVDGLHKINREEGYFTGDKLIKDTAKLLKTAFDQCNGTEVFRIGGDEFGVLIKGFNKEILESVLLELKNVTCAYTVVSTETPYASPSDVFRQTDSEVIRLKSQKKPINQEDFTI